jgi:Domain of unknown function (DUF5018)
VAALFTQNKVKTNSKIYLIIVLFVMAWACKKPEEKVTPITPTHVPAIIVVKSSANDILTFSFNNTSPKVNSKVDLLTKEITALLPMEADLKILVPTITISEKANISPATDVVQDFSKDVIYTVTAEDGTTKSFTVKANTDGFHYPNIRMTVNETKDYLQDSCLISYSTGKVFQLKDGAKNAKIIDGFFDGYCGLDMYSIGKIIECGVSCGVGNKNKIIVGQAWPEYRTGAIEFITKNEVTATNGQVPYAKWTEANFAADINSIHNNIKLEFKNSANYSYLVSDVSGSPCIPTNKFDKVLYRIVTQDGKKGLIKLNSFGKKGSGYYVVFDIKIQK